MKNNEFKGESMEKSIIEMILSDFKSFFNISAQIIYDSRENVTKNNPEFKIGSSAAGFRDDKLQTIYLFSDVIEEIRKRNYYNEFNQNDNGLTYLILASFHELEHHIQRKYPEILNEEKLGAPKAMLEMENLIIKANKFLPGTSKFDYNRIHDNFLLEIDADKKGTINSRNFSKYHKIPKINQRYLNLMDEYNTFRINNYDIPIFVDQFIKIINQYPDILKDRRWLNCNELIQFFNPNGTLKSIKELMCVHSRLTPYFVSSIDCIKSINETQMTEEQIFFVSKCLSSVIDEHNEKQRNLKNLLPSIETVINELRKYTEVNGKNSKSNRCMANENYYNYLYQVQEYLKFLERKYAR